MARNITEGTEAKPLHECDPQEFKALAAETWGDVFAAADQRATWPTGTVSLSDFIGTGDDAA